MTRPRILVINDEPAMQEFFHFNLTVRGYDVLVVKGSGDVLVLVKNEQPHLVILDLMVSAVDGFELCQKICESARTSVIAFNMRGGEADLLRCLAMGVEDYLGKPFGVDELLARIRAVLRHKGLNRAAEIAVSTEWSKR
jgi:DNA-binding response OmpR family regulator